MTITTEIKICGLTNLEQSQACVELGVGWLGFNCYEGSKRYCPPSHFETIISQLSESVQKVGVFVNSPAEEVQAIAKGIGLDWVQLHGDEPWDYCQSLEIPFIKAFRVNSNFDLQQLENPHKATFLLDAFHPQHYGGSGETFDWELAQQAKAYGGFFLAGGITPDNAAEAIAAIQPYGLDLCSGVETSPGIKDLGQVAKLMSQVAGL